MESTRTRLFLLHHLSFGSLEHPPFLRISAKGRTSSVAELGHVVVLLLRAVVPQAPTVVSATGAVVLQVLTVVPLLGSGSTVASGLHSGTGGSRGGCNFLHPRSAR